MPLATPEPTLVTDTATSSGSPCVTAVGVGVIATARSARVIGRVIVSEIPGGVTVTRNGRLAERKLEVVPEKVIDGNVPSADTGPGWVHVPAPSQVQPSPLAVT